MMMVMITLAALAHNYTSPSNSLPLKMAANLC